MGGVHPLVSLWFPESLEKDFWSCLAPIRVGDRRFPWRDCGVIGTLLGTRMVLNELVGSPCSDR